MMMMILARMLCALIAVIAGWDARKLKTVEGTFRNLPPFCCRN